MKLHLNVDDLKASKDLLTMSMNKVREVIGDYLKNLPIAHARIIERVVHATADPEFGKLIVISDWAVESGIRALKSGAKVVTDVEMVRAGLNKARLRKFGIRVECHVDDEAALRMAKEMGTTRTAAAMHIAIEMGLDGAIVVIGNSPTAAFEVASAVRGGRAKPALIIATPVGFIGASESKEEIMKLQVPHIVVKGPRGGSPVAVAIFNALLTLAEEHVEGLN